MLHWLSGRLAYEKEKKSSQLYSYLSAYNFAIGIQLKMLNNSLLFLSGSLTCQQFLCIGKQIPFLKQSKHSKKIRKRSVNFEVDLFLFFSHHSEQKKTGKWINKTAQKFLNDKTANYGPMGCDFLCGSSLCLSSVGLDLITLHS